MIALEVLIFLKWVRYVVEEILWDRPHVIINADETSLTSVKHGGTGMVTGNASVKRPEEQNHGMVQAVLDPESRTLPPSWIVQNYNLSCRK